MDDRSEQPAASLPAELLTQLIDALLQVEDEEALVAFWQQLPAELEDTLIIVVEQRLAQVKQAGDQRLADALAPRLEGLRQIRDWQRAQTSHPILQAFITALASYRELVQVAQASEDDVVAWQAATTAGEALLTSELAVIPHINWQDLRADLATSYNQLGNALEHTGERTAMLTAFDRAITLQPDFAMWRRNRTGTLIDLGRLDEAAAELAHARTLEPEAPRLTELAAALEQAWAQISRHRSEESGDGTS